MTNQETAVLFVCTGNAGRSQMAQALFREQAGPSIRIESAGVAPWDHLHPLAVKLMRERGLSLDGHHPKSVASVAGQPFDWVVTLGDQARALLPKSRFSAAYWVHWDMADPADADGTPNAEVAFRRAVAAIDERLPELSRQIAGRPSLSRYAGRPGIGTGLWGRQRFSPSAHLPLVAEAGFSAIELCLYRGRDHFDWDDAGAVRELRRAADDLGMLVWSVHSPDLGSVASPDAAERRRQTDALKMSVDVAERLGARVVVSHALLFGPFAEEPAACETRIAAFLEEMAGPGETSPAKIGFENAGFAAPAAARTNRLLRRLEAVSPAAYGFVLDTGHTNLDGDLGLVETAAGPQLISVHLNDNDGRDDFHLAPGEGTVDWSAVRRTLQRCGYHGVWMYEVEPGPHDPAERLKTTMAGHHGRAAATEARG